MGELGVLPSKFARSLAPIAGFRNILVHEYISVDWDEVYKQLENLDELVRYATFIVEWLRKKNPSQT